MGEGGACGLGKGAGCGYPVWLAGGAGVLGDWRSWLARVVDIDEVTGSSPVSPTFAIRLGCGGGGRFEGIGGQPAPRCEPPIDGPRWRAPDW